MALKDENLEDHLKILNSHPEPQSRKKMLDQILRVKLKNLFKVILFIAIFVLFEKYRKGDQEFSEIIDEVEDEFLAKVKKTKFSIKITVKLEQF